MWCTHTFANVGSTPQNFALTYPKTITTLYHSQYCCSGEGTGISKYNSDLSIRTIGHESTGVTLQILNNGTGTVATVYGQVLLVAS